MKKLGNVYILGDSLSTFKGYIPETHAPCYKPVMEDDNDVTDVNKTWWKIVLNNTESELILNDSWSGTTICNTGYDKADVSNRSFISRFDKLTEEGFFKNKKIDTVFVFGGTNDNWANAPLGEPKHSNWTKEDLYNVLPAIWYLFNRLRIALPKARIITIINTDFKKEITDNLKAASQHYGCECLQLKNINKMNGHPGIVCMMQIAEQILDFI